MPQPVPALGGEGGHKVVVFIQIHAIRVGENVNIPDVAAGIVADVHGVSDLKHGAFVALACVKGGGELRVAEGVEHAVIANLVAGAEVLVRRIVEHAPAEAAGVFSVGHGGVQNSRVAQGMLLTLAPGVKALGGEHMPAVLGDEQRLIHIGRYLVLGAAAGILSGVGEVVEGVNILEQAALFDVAHAGGGAARIELAAKLVGALIEFVVVLALVDANAPEHDARVAAVLRHHLPYILHRLLLPGRVPHMLPAGDLGEDHQPQLVAGVDKVPALGIVGGAHGVAVQLLLQNARVLKLQVRRGGVADVGVALMAV